MQFVLDASVTLAWCFTDEASLDAADLLGRLDHGSAIAPAIWELEVISALVIGVRRGRMDPPTLDHTAAILAELPIHVAHSSPGHGFDTVRKLSLATGLTPYDASYLDLAMSHELPLATLDTDLRRAAREQDVAVLPDA